MFSIIGNSMLISFALLSGFQLVLFKKINQKPAVILTQCESSKFAVAIGIFACLILAFITKDYKVANVAANSDVLLPWYYKIAASWSSHEGSMLLWLIIMQGYSFVYNLLDKGYDKHKVHTLQIHNLLIFLFTVYIMLFANPLSYGSQENLASGLNPVLQNAFLLIHPPKLYLGYVGTTMVYAFCLAILTSCTAFTQKVVKNLYYIILFAWITLTGGIILGSRWAYQELGWGGFWAWDPVENISLLPWFFLTAMMHSNKAIERNKKGFEKITVISGFLAFASVLCGTLLIRSGGLDSVHSFTPNKESGLGLAAILTCVVSLFCWFYKKRADQLSADQPINLNKSLGLDSLIKSAITLLYILSGILFIGIILPFFGLLVGKPFNIEMDYYNILCGVMMAPLLLTCIIASSKLHPQPKFANRYLIIKSALSLLLAGTIYMLYGSPCELINIACFPIIVLTFYLFLENLRYIFSYSRAAFVSHLGFSLIIIGAITASLFQKSYNTTIIKGISQPFFDNFEINLTDIKYEKSDNYFTRIAVINIAKNGKSLGTLRPETRFFPTSDNFTVKSDYLTYRFSDIYLLSGSMKEVNGNKSMEVKIFFKPLINLLWLGGVLVVYGGLYGLILHYTSSKRSRSE